jgi:pilus assembly protein Flp/PilA
MNKLLQFLRSEDGPTAVEYAVMLAMIVMFCIGAIQILGQATSGSFEHSNNAIQDAMTP